MEIKKAINNQNVIISLKGRLDTMTSPLLEEEISNTDFDNIEVVTLNLADLEYISSAGLRVILSLYNKMKGLNGELKIVNVNSSVMELFTMTGMADYLNIETA